MSIGGTKNKENLTTSGTTSETTSEESFADSFMKRMPVIDEDWRQRQGGLYGLLSGDGYTPEQKTALQYFDNWMDKDATTLKSIQADYPDTYQELVPVKAQQVQQQNVGVERGASELDKWQSPYTDQVVSAALGDLDERYARLRNQGELAQAGANPYGMGGSGDAIRRAQLDDDYLRNVASTAANLRNQGFTTAAGLTQQDKGFDLQGQQISADNSLRAQLANQNALMQQQIENNRMQNQRDMFDVNQAGVADAYRFDAGNQLYGMGQGAVGNLTNLLNIGTKTFGDTAESSELGGSTSQSDATVDSRSTGGSTGKGFKI